MKIGEIVGIEKSEMIIEFSMSRPPRITYHRITIKQPPPKPLEAGSVKVRTAL
jgi:hypothetical protein